MRVLTTEYSNSHKFKGRGTVRVVERPFRDGTIEFHYHDYMISTRTVTDSRKSDIRNDHKVVCNDRSGICESILEVTLIHN